MGSTIPTWHGAQRFLDRGAMGKKQHQKDKLYISATEWKHEWGGKKAQQERKAYRVLPFDRCALSLQPFETPVCSPEGNVFDILNIIPYLKKHKNRNPVTGKELQPKDLIRLHFHKNTDGQYHCPVTFKVFTDNSHIVAIRNTGNVFSWEAIETLNIKPKSWQELLTGDTFSRADIITLQDPLHLEHRNVEAFQHVQQAAAAPDQATAAEEKTAPALINAGNESVVRMMKKIPDDPCADAARTYYSAQRGGCTGTRGTARGRVGAAWGPWPDLFGYKARKFDHRGR